MPWVRIEDSFLTHPKALTAGKDGRALWFAGLLYCARELTDGFIPVGALRSIAGTAEVRPSTVNKLTTPWRADAEPLWHEVEGGWQMHDYLDYQPSAEEVQVKRAKERDRKARGRRKQGRDPETGRVTSNRKPPNVPAGIPSGQPTGQTTGHPTGHPAGRDHVSQGGGAPVPSPITTNGCRDSHVSPTPDDDGTDDETPPNLEQLTQAIARARSARLGGGHNPVWIRTTAARLNRAAITEALQAGHTDPAELDQILDGNRPEPQPVHPALAATRPACATCDGMRHIETDDDTVTPCPDCSSVPA